MTYNQNENVRTATQNGEKLENIFYVETGNAYTRTIYYLYVNNICPFAFKIMIKKIKINVVKAFVIFKRNIPTYIPTRVEEIQINDIQYQIK